MKTGTEVLGNRYRIVRPLGGGGMKSVYLAEDLKLSKRLCAVAAMIDNFADPDEQQAAVAAFQREADMLASLRNDHIPQIYDKFSEQQSHYLVMEFIEGDTLEKRIKVAGGKLSEQEAIDIAIQMLETLEYLHGLNPPVIYRDMKPGNVMVTPGGKVKLIDFGIARFFQQTTMTLVGTPGYSPREQYGGKVEERSDLYALAAALHEALSGRPAVPFDFPPLLQLCPGSNQHLSDLIGQALADKVEDRVPNAREFKNRLAAIKAELAAGPAQSMQASQQRDNTVPVRRTTTQPDSQTWVFKDTGVFSGPIGQSGSNPVPNIGRQASSRNLSQTASSSSSQNISNDKTEVLTQIPGLQGAAMANVGNQDQTAVLAAGGPGVTGAAPGLNGQTWVFREGTDQGKRGGRSSLKLLIGLASIAAVAVAAVAGVNQWNEIQREKDLIDAHEKFEQQQQQELQAAERQKELLLQQQAEREAELRRQRQEAALEQQRRWRRQRQLQQPPAPYPYPTVAEAAPTPSNSGFGGAIASGVAGALGGVVGGLIGGTISGGSGGSASSRPAYPQPYYPPPRSRPPR